VIVGILGGGQLARMIALAGHPLGLRFLVLDPAADCCAAPLATHLRGDYDDPALLDRMAREADVITYEFENVPAQSVARLAALRSVHPAAAALEAAQDRLREKRLFRQLGIDTAPFAAVESRAELEEAVREIGLPAVLKTRRFGYDGKGQAVLRAQADLDRAWTELGGMPLILEGFVPFERELSILAVRGSDGAVAFWPLAENKHRNGILHLSHCRPDEPLQGQAEAYARRLLEETDYVGVVAVELFQCGEQLIANEFAPRVHNSGHWTIEGAETSQFENHLRAVCGLPLGTTAPVGRAAMLNFIGALPPREKVLALDGVHLHDYGKAERPGRKVGHATVRADDKAALAARLERLLVETGLG